MKSVRRWCARAGCRHAPSAHRGRGACTLPGCDCAEWADTIRHWWRELCVDTWFWADAAWQRAAEEASNGWTTELAEYRAEYPRPLYKLTLIELSQGSDPEA